VSQELFVLLGCAASGLYFCMLSLKLAEKYKVNDFAAMCAGVLAAMNVNLLTIRILEHVGVLSR
jgi:hypothetical protein